LALIGELNRKQAALATEAIDPAGVALLDRYAAELSELA
jgi:hypothetical protein